MTSSSREQDLFETDNDLLMYAFVRDIHYDEGLHLITPAGLSEAEVTTNLERMNAIVPCNPKLFSLPQSFLMKPELVDDVLSNLNAAHIGGSVDVKHILTDLLL